mgnify:CR=1
MTSLLFPAAGFITLLCAAIVWAEVWYPRSVLHGRPEPLIATLLIIAIGTTSWGFISIEAVSANTLNFTL